MAVIAERIIARDNGEDPDRQPGPHAIEAAYLEAFHSGAISQFQLDFYRLQLRGAYVVSRLTDHGTTGEKVSNLVAYASGEDYLKEQGRSRILNRNRSK